MSDFYLDQLHHGVVRFAREAGWQLSAGMVHGGVLPPHIPRDGLLVTASTENVARWLALETCPVVHLLTNPRFPQHPHAAPDWDGAGRAGATHLIEQGFRNLVFYQYSPIEESERLAHGFLNHAASCGVSALRLHYLADNPWAADLRSQDHRISWLMARFAGLPRPFAIMGEDDRFAVEAVSACEALGLRIPQDVAVLGCDDNALHLGVSRIRISSVDTNLPEVGYQAARLLQSILDGQPAPASPAIIPVRGVAVRDSTDTFATSIQGVRIAWNYIREHFRGAISIPSLASRAGMSARSLQAHFKRETGRTLTDEITRRRITHAARLLRDTDLKLSSIAHESGLGQPSYLHRLFDRHYQTTPRRYREKHRTSRDIPLPETIGD